MKALKAKDNIWWVGSLDPDIKIFDIVMETEKGTTYNSYVIKGNEKTVLVEVVKEKFFEDHLEKVKEVTNPEDIDYIIFNHTEPDHSGSLGKFLEIAKNAKVVGTNTAINFLKEIVNKPFESIVATEQTKLDIGGMTLHFMPLPMLHWPDTMFTYIPELKALFTCDCFGCHYSDPKVFNDQIKGDFYGAYKYYFDNIISPYKNPFMVNALNRIEGLDFDFIGTGHGPVLRKDVKKYIDYYKQWCVPVKKENKFVCIAYVSAYGYTKKLAEKIAEGIKSVDSFEVKLYDLVTDDNDKALSDISEADGFLIGSPTLVGDALPPIYKLLAWLNPVIHKGKFAGAFGSYGWSGEAVPNITARLEKLKMNIPLEGLRVKLKPTVTDEENAVNFGKDFAKAIINSTK